MRYFLYSLPIIFMIHVSHQTWSMHPQELDGWWWGVPSLLSPFPEQEKPEVIEALRYGVTYVAAICAMKREDDANTDWYRRVKAALDDEWAEESIAADVIGVWRPRNAPTPEYALEVTTTALRCPHGAGYQHELECMRVALTTLATLQDSRLDAALKVGKCSEEVQAFFEKRARWRGLFDEGIRQWLNADGIAQNKRSREEDSEDDEDVNDDERSGSGGCRRRMDEMSD